MLSDAQLSELYLYFPAIQEGHETLRNRVAALAEPIQAPTGTVLYEPGQSPTGLVLVTRGSVRVALAHGRRQAPLYRVRPGQTCLLTAVCLLSKAPYDAVATAEADVFAIRLPSPLPGEWLEHEPGFRQFLLRGLAARVLELVDRLSDTWRRGLVSRLAELLLSRPSPVERSHQELAQELGTAREVVSRLLERFESDGWVRLERRQVLVTDPERLRQAASGS